MNSSDLPAARARRPPSAATLTGLRLWFSHRTACARSHRDGPGLRLWSLTVRARSHTRTLPVRTTHGASRLWLSHAPTHTLRLWLH